jgi:Tol biopolymer transport system component/predicted Ser/Thr protein kinase
MHGTDAEHWREIEELYHAACERGPGERAALLAQAEPELRLEVESLLGQQSGDALLHHSALDQAIPFGRPPEAPPLAPGSQLGRYTIESPLGNGGMGNVHKARDSRLGRLVAIKVSQERFSARFEREARAISSLNHGNICTLYDVGPNYLVMELVEGPTLAARIKEGPIPLDQALKIARQIADALEAAHQAGIVHRDLKPGNIHLKPGGAVKVLDFGLAKVAAPLSHPDDSPGLALDQTKEGIILGTAAYMAPEQAAGKPVDKRADIWAFGVVLYEMLTGKRLFAGETVSETLASVIKDEPRLDAVPRKARRLLESCLERDPQRRLRDIGDAWRLLDGEQTGVETPEPAPARVNKLAGLSWKGALVTVLVLGLAFLGAWFWRAAPPSGKLLLRLNVDLGSDVSLDQFAILSPDGTRLAYASKWRLYTRRLDQAQSTELVVASEEILSPFFSPDGKWVAFFLPGKLMKVSVESGAQVKLCDVDPVHMGGSTGGSWAGDYIIAALAPTGGLWRIPAAGGRPQPVTAVDHERGEVTHRWPQILPGGKAVLFTAHTKTMGGFDEATIEAVDLRNGRRKTLLRGGAHARYLPSGHLVFMRRNTLFAVPFDLDRLEVRGSPSAVLDGITNINTTGDAYFDFSQTGTFIYDGVEGSRPAGVIANWMDALGHLQPLVTRPGSYSRPRLSPDGQRLAMRVSDPSGMDIWVYDVQRDTRIRLTDGSTAPDSPVWTPDGRFVVFDDLQTGGMFWSRADGGGKPQRLTRSKNVQQPYSVSPDGKRLAFMEQGSSGFDLWTVPIRGDGVTLQAGAPEPFLQTPFDERHGAFSPDGRWLAYSSNETGAFEVYVRAFPDRGEKWQVSNGGGVTPVWSPAGHELFYRTEDQRIIVASYTVTGDSFRSDKPRQWSEQRPAKVSGRTGANFDVAPDGKRLAVLMSPGGGPEPHHVIFLENFFDEIRRRLKP